MVVENGVKINILGGYIMNKYYYCVNTFKDSEPVQLRGYIEARYETDAIQKLIDNGTIDPYSYEFLTLEEVKEYDYY